MTTQPTEGLKAQIRRDREVFRLMTPGEQWAATAELRSIFVNPGVTFDPPRASQEQPQ